MHCISILGEMPPMDSNDFGGDGGGDEPPQEPQEPSQPPPQDLVPHPGPDGGDGGGDSGDDDEEMDDEEGVESDAGSEAETDMVVLDPDHVSSKKLLCLHIIYLHIDSDCDHLHLMNFIFLNYPTASHEKIPKCLEISFDLSK